MAPSPGVLDAARGALVTVLEVLGARLALLATDWEEERMRLARIAILAAVGLVLVVLALVCAIALVVVFFWDTHRLAALVGATLVLALAAAAAFLRVGMIARARPRLFDATLAELERDREALGRVAR